MVYNYWYVYSKYELYEVDIFYGEFFFFVLGCVYVCGSVKLLKNFVGLLFYIYDYFFVVNYIVQIGKINGCDGFEEQFRDVMYFDSFQFGIIQYYYICGLDVWRVVWRRK